MLLKLGGTAISARCTLILSYRYFLVYKCLFVVNLGSVVPAVAGDTINILYGGSVFSDSQNTFTNPVASRTPGIAATSTDDVDLPRVQVDSSVDDGGSTCVGTSLGLCYYFEYTHF